MSRIYLVRHGQAGTRNAYDTLSELGIRQARLLGDHFAAEGIRFAAAFAGTQERQARTAAEVRAAYWDAGVCFPEIACDCGWNEFDLAGIYRELAPRLCAEDPEFRKEYEEVTSQARALAEQPDARVHRRWLPCDSKLIDAWMAQRHVVDVETWEEFRGRVMACRSKLSAIGADAEIVVFTSAVPIGIWTALAMDIHDDRALRLAGVLRNTSCTELRLRDAQLRLDSFNAVPHLKRPELRTYR